MREKLASCTRSALVAFSEGLLKQARILAQAYSTQRTKKINVPDRHICVPDAASAAADKCPHNMSHNLQVTEALQQLAAAVAPDATADDDERSASAVGMAVQLLRAACATAQRQHQAAGTTTSRGDAHNPACRASVLLHANCSCHRLHRAGCGAAGTAPSSAALHRRSA